MIKNHFKIPVVLGVAALSVASCTDYDAGFTAESFKQQQYADNFEKAFGTPDPNQDWSMATLVSARVNLPSISGSAKMNVMTGDPHNADTRLLAQVYLQDGQASFDFDAVKGYNNVFVTVEQNNEYKIYGRYVIVDGMLQIGNVFNSTRAGVQVSNFSATCPAEKDGDLIEINLPYTPQSSGSGSEETTPATTVTYICVNNNGEWYTQDEWIQKVNQMWEDDTSTNHTNFQNSAQPFVITSIATFINDDPSWRWQGFSNTELDWSNPVLKSESEGVKTEERSSGGSGSSGTTTSKVQLQYLKNVETTAATPWLFGWGYNLFGTNAIFQESVTYYLPYKTAINSKTEVAEGEVGYQKYGLLYGEDDLAKIEAGFEITVSGGSVEMPFIYGATITPDQFGYVYWQDGEDPLSKPHYILMDDARPNSNIYWDSWGSFEGSTGSAVGNMSLSVFSNFEAVMKTKDNGIRQCKCESGNGKWSVAHGDHDYAEHAEWCKTTERDKYEDAANCNCYCNKRGTGIYSGELAAHTAQCEFYFDDYLAAYNKKVYGSSYKLMYFGDNGENTTGSYTFPEDKTYHIAFFINPLSNENKLTAHDGEGLDLGKYHYSVPELNRRIQHLYNYTLSPSFETGNDTQGSGNERGRVKCISWTQSVTDLNGNTSQVTLLGFGDESGDHDLNDIVFMVAGDFTPTTDLLKVAPIKWHMNTDPSTHTDEDLYFSENKTVGTTYAQPSTFPTRDGFEFLGWATTATGTPVAKSNSEVAIKDQTTPAAGVCYYAIWKAISDPTPDPEYISWLFACEDLGGTWDYDFNDVVWEVQKTKVGEEITAVKVRVLAAGGTLPFTLKYNGTPICTKTEAFEGISTATVVNAGSVTTTKAVKEFTVTGIGTDWNVSDSYTKFTVEVENEDGSSSFITSNMKSSTSKSNAPQIILLPGEWEWPTETTPIDEAYPDFTNWATDATWTAWRANKVSGKTVTR